MLSAKVAKKIIRDLLDAGHDNALVCCQDGGENVDVVFSRLKGHTESVMTLKEAEEFTDKVIRCAYLKMTGVSLEGDPVEFVNS